MNSIRVRAGMSKSKGQAPFLILILCAMFACAMLVMNLGKVSVNRLNTQNAADAGALAASSWLASGLNYVSGLKAPFHQGVLDFRDWLIEAGEGQYYVGEDGCDELRQIIDEFNQAMREYVAALQDFGTEIADLADEQGKAYAFFNAGVDERKLRADGQSYEDWLREKSPFEEWLEDKGYKTGRGSVARYEWQDNIYQYAEPKAGLITYKSDRSNEVRVEANGPSGLGIGGSGEVTGVTQCWVEVANPPDCDYHLDIDGDGAGDCDGDICDEDDEDCFLVCCPTGTSLESIDIEFSLTPAFLSIAERLNVEIVTNRKEPDADLRLWYLNMPEVESSSTARAFIDGGDYDCRIVGAK